MLFPTFLATLFLGIGLVFAKDDKPHKSDIIVHALHDIAHETEVLNSTLWAWDGSLFDALAINAQNDVLLKTIKALTENITETSPKLGVPSALRVKRATKEMMGTIDGTVGTIVDFEYRFRSVMLAGQVKKNLMDIREASANLNAVIRAKIPKIGRGIARRLGKKIDKIFERAIDEYESKTVN